ncbi:SpoIIE family protein phosphatase [Kineococcus sp. R8]|uniref:SpoIIE family protein phosphatase n=1 Tax=Kineococcus siccus TaxID=2696567 RepID=UPI001412F06E|nr:SpoIIE family protein phosphatase [Kineococcus siccus]
MPHVVLPARLSAVPDARHWVAAECRDRLSPAERGVVELLTSELVANAVLHGARAAGDGRERAVEVRVDTAGGVVRVVVQDGNPDPPVLRHVGAEATGGRGVALVDALATRWGYEPLPSPGVGKTVWFELAPPSARAATSAQEGTPVPALPAGFPVVPWEETALGAVGAWTDGLRSAVDLALQTRFPVCLFWGPDLSLVYNEAFVPLIADKHPAALGTPAREVFPEIWDRIGPLLQDVLDGAGPAYAQDERLLMDRHGYPEECFFTFCYSPVRTGQGPVEGVLDIAMETTTTVVDRRRLDLLSRLGDVLAAVEDVGDVVSRALPLLRTQQEDLPAVGLRLDGLAAPDDGEPRLPGRPAAPTTGRDLVLERTPHGTVAWLPLTAGTAARSGGAALAVLLSEHVPPDERYLDYLRLIAGGVAQALARLEVRAAERRASAFERGMAESLQRNLLEPPPQPDHLEIGVRYLPAADHARIGGDWYDSFLVPGGALTVLVGDVAGHDREAAAAMAQVRNLLRGVSFTLQEPPAAVMSGLDRAMRGLGVDIVATAVVVQIEQDEAAAAAGTHTARWTSAGHPPPVLLGADGSARLLETSPDLLLGVEPTLPRADHLVDLPPGAGLVLYTDGLVERRGEPLQEGLERLRRLLEGAEDLTAEQVCDRVLGLVADGPQDDDVALLVLRADRQDRRDAG